MTVTTVPPIDAPEEGLLLETALSYARRGWKVLPLYAPDETGVCDCYRVVDGHKPEDPRHPIGKHPCTKHGLTDATAEETVVRSWWGKLFKRANIAVATGASSGFVALDVDPRHGGGKSLEELERQHGRLPDTVEAWTGGGGRHLLFAHPGRPVPNKVSLADGLDVRGDGGYIVVAPSLHASGKRYSWNPDSRPDEWPMAPLPAWLLAIIEAGPRAESTAAAPVGETIPEGRRNATLVSLAGSMRRRGMSEDAIFAALCSENQARCRPPLDEGEVRKIAKSVARYAPATQDRFPSQMKVLLSTIHAMIGAGCDDATITSVLLDPTNEVGAPARKLGRPWLADQIAGARSNPGNPQGGYSKKPGNTPAEPGSRASRPSSEPGTPGNGIPGEPPGEPGDGVSRHPSKPGSDEGGDFPASSSTTPDTSSGKGGAVEELSTDGDPLVAVALAKVTSGPRNDDGSLQVDAVFAAAPELARLTLQDYGSLKAAFKAQIGKALNLNDLDRAVAELRREARKTPKEVDPNLPNITVTDRPLRDTSGAARRILLEANTPEALFVRSGILVQVRADEKGRPLVEPLNEAHMRGRLTRVANFLKTTKDGPIHTTPPEDLVRDILYVGPWPFPPLEAIVEIPTMREDGTILDKTGYDPTSELLFYPAQGLKISEIPDTPTADETAAALASVEDILVDFPFEDQASKANAIAAMLTPMLRPAIKGSIPMGLFDKPKAGTGASLLTEVIASIATGRSAAMMTAPSTDEEWRKKITSLLTEGQTFIIVDNVEHPILAPSLASVLTSDVWRDRPLGRSETVTVAHRATWFATGNNIQLGGDLPRRCYWIRMDSQLARPWERDGSTFRHPQLLSYVAHHRGELVAALLTLARSWFTAGCPAGKVRPFGKFEEWARIIGGILTHVGVTGFLDNMDRLYQQMDEETGQWEGFLTAWHDVYGSKAITVAGLIGDLKSVETSKEMLGEDLAGKLEELRSSLPDDLSDAMSNPKASFQRKLGKALAKRAFVRFGDLRLERGQDDAHTKVGTWSVRTGEELRGLRVLRGLIHSDAGPESPTFNREDREAGENEIPGQETKGVCITGERRLYETPQTPQTPQSNDLFAAIGDANLPAGGSAEDLEEGGGTEEADVYENEVPEGEEFDEGEL